MGASLLGDVPRALAQRVARGVVPEKVLRLSDDDAALLLWVMLGAVGLLIVGWIIRRVTQSR